MKQILSCLLVLYIPLFVFSQTDSLDKGIKWTTGLSWEQVKQKAKDEDKYIFIDCYATWCAPCHMMDKKVFSNAILGEEMSKNFISIKVQIDSTDNDNAQIRKWYNDAKFIASKYGVVGVPTYLFFTPDGRFVHRDNGYKNFFEFQNLKNMAQDPEKPQLYSLYEKYQKGQKIKNQNLIPRLAVFAYKYIDKNAAHKLAKNYIDNYLSKMEIAKLKTWDYLDFISWFPELVNSTDKIFELCYNQPKLFDSIAKSPGRATFIVQQAIYREELDNKLKKDGRGVIENPDWTSLEKNIAAKYPKAGFEKNWFIDYKVSYYSSSLRNWRRWAEAKNEKFKLFPPTLENYQASWHLAGDLNDFGAWLAFLRCDDTVVLKEALKWIDLAIEFDKYTPAYVDTKANLLYKLGRNREAIEMQEIAVALCHIPRHNWALSKYEDKLEMMKKGEPTWPVASK